jgi:tetratricopeptide (TPR) repeat protein
MTDRSGDFPRLDRLTDEQLQRLAHSEKLAERHDLALACFEEASRRFPGHAGILLEQLKCHQRLRNAASVEALARELGARLSADPSRLDELGEELQKLGLFSLAEETFRMLLNHPRAEVRAVGWSRVAALQLRTGSREDATATPAWPARSCATSSVPARPSRLLSPPTAAICWQRCAKTSVFREKPWKHWSGRR